MNGNKQVIYQNIWDITKAVHKGKCIAVNIYIKKKKSQINLTLHFKKLGKSQTKPKARSKEIKIRA